MSHHRYHRSVEENPFVRARRYSNKIIRAAKKPGLTAEKLVTLGNQRPRNVQEMLFKLKLKAFAPLLDEFKAFVGDPNIDEIINSLTPHTVGPHSMMLVMQVPVKGCFGNALLEEWVTNECTSEDGSAKPISSELVEKLRIAADRFKRLAAANEHLGIILVNPRLKDKFYKPHGLYHPTFVIAMIAKAIIEKLTEAYPALDYLCQNALQAWEKDFSTQNGNPLATYQYLTTLVDIINALLLPAQDRNTANYVSVLKSLLTIDQALKKFTDVSQYKDKTRRVMSSNTPQPGTNLPSSRPNNVAETTIFEQILKDPFANLIRLLTPYKNSSKGTRIEGVNHQEGSSGLLTELLDNLIVSLFLNQPLPALEIRAACNKFSTLIETAKSKGLVPILCTPQRAIHTAQDDNEPVLSIEQRIFLLQLYILETFMNSLDKESGEYKTLLDYHERLHANLTDKPILPQDFNIHIRMIFVTDSHDPKLREVIDTIGALSSLKEALSDFQVIEPASVAASASFGTTETRPQHEPISTQPASTDFPGTQLRDPSREQRKGFCAEITSIFFG